MTTLEILKAARDLLSDEKRWTKGVGARDASGAAIYWRSDEVHCRCAYIAIATACGERLQDEKAALVDLGFHRGSDFIDWNDAPARTHAEVLQRFDDAIARLTAQTVSS